jgi:TalC/MipB family fructose-6-phosphate aldolase
MEFLFDTANIDEIERYSDQFPITGVTTNPSILKTEGNVDFFPHMRHIRAIIGKERSLHIQVVASDTEDIIIEAEEILSHIDERVFIKIPVNEAGLRAIRRLKADGVGVTATAIYSKIQAYMAIAAGADYIAPYWNRMENVDVDPIEMVRAMAAMIAHSKAKTKILAASFKNIAQVNEALMAGSHCVTLPPSLLHQAFGMAAIQQAIDNFSADWKAIHGDTTITDLARIDKIPENA